MTITPEPNCAAAVCGCVLMLPPAHSGTPTGVPSAGDTRGDRAEQGRFAGAEAAGSG